MRTNPKSRTRRRTSSRPRITPRHWCIPSAILRSPGETLNGISILEEIPDSVGLLLWLTLDDVTLWATSPPKTRDRLAGLCSPHRLAVLGEGTPAELRYRLELLSALLAVPGDTDAEMLGVACLAVGAWARGLNHPRTALAFAQAGALAAPMFPDAAMQTAICAQEVHEPIRAETWLRRAVAVARRANDWDTYSNAYVLLGRLQLARQQLTDADGSLLIAFRTARRYGNAIARRDASYGLFQIANARALQSYDACSRDRFLVEADTYAAAAYRAYSADQAGAVPMLLDIAGHWLTRGDAEEALGPLARLRTMMAHLTPDDALRAAAMTARAYAAARRKKLTASRAADERASQMLSFQSISEEAAFAASMDLAYAAVDRRDRASFDRARSAALRFAPNPKYESTSALLVALAESWAPAGACEEGR